ncbi:MAG: hypothetical protein IPM56_08005 [Ignavibacteriales bacterium]|nr:MAG: hypothetical protein IPM56_08005 [Ignavibacteriales bacterium]
MKTKHIFWGLLFISIGVLVLLNNFGVMNLYWSNVWKFWPLVIVLWGISFMTKHQFVKNIIVGCSAIFLAVVLFTSVRAATNLVNDDIEFVIDGDDIEYDVTTYYQPFDSTIQYSTLNFDAGAGSFIMKNTTDSLIAVVTEGIKNNYSFSNSVDAHNAVLDLDMKFTKFSLGKGKHKNKVDISLNTNPVWDVHFDIGAAKMDLDLTPYKTENITIDMGAASLLVRLGDKTEETRLRIDAGASSIEIEIPDSSGCEITSDAVLSSKNFEGFYKTNSDIYRTNGFEEAKNKIYIDLEAGVSSIKVRRIEAPAQKI